MCIEELNEKYFALFGELFANRGLLTPEQYKTMSKVLTAEYQKELDICLTEKLLATGVATFQLKFKSKNYLPRRRFLCWNKVAKSILRQLKAEFDNELKAMQETLKKKKKQIKTETANCTSLQPTAIEGEEIGKQ